MEKETKKELSAENRKKVSGGTETSQQTLTPNTMKICRHCGSANTNMYHVDPKPFGGKLFRYHCLDCDGEYTWYKGPSIF